MPTYIVLWGAVSLAASAMAGFLAGWKNRDYSFWMAWCLIVPPLVLWLALMPKNKGTRPRQPTLDSLDRNEGMF